MAREPTLSLIDRISSAHMSQYMIDTLRHHQRRVPQVWQPVLWLALASLPFAVWYRVKRKSLDEDSDSVSNDAVSTEPGLLKKWSSFSSYHVPSTGFTYPSIRTFYRQHPQVSKLPCAPTPLPLLVFIHGLGGSAAQFNSLLTSLVNVGPCLVIDLPGCGLSEFAPRDWDAYTSEALLQLLRVIIESHRDVENEQGVIMIGHSIGCSLAAKLASSLSKNVGELPMRTVGFIAICPRGSQLSESQESGLRKLLLIPTFLFNLMRKWDQRGGEESNSVRRFVGQGAEPETKKLQLRFNEQSKTAVWRRMAYGLLPVHTAEAISYGLPTDETWAGLKVPIFLIGGEADKVTSPEEVGKLASIIQSSWKASPGRDMTERKLSDPNSTLHHNITPSFDGSIDFPSDVEADPEQFKPHKALKTTILPDPASHALLFAPSTVRVISGLIQSFLSMHVDPRLSLGWQLQYLSTEGKWDVKNLQKWQAVDPVSEPIAGIFRAMKTMREVDDEHCPKEFAKKYHDAVRAVVDISHESPVYDPKGLENGGIQYYKFPTVSKHPPQDDEVTAFIALIDGILSEPESQPFPSDAAADGTSNVASEPSSSPSKPANSNKTIAVHCHYGFNRTGFLIVCYLIERRGWRLQDAVEAFGVARPPGIKHDYFVDSLAVRYAKGLGRAPTL